MDNDFIGFSFNGISSQSLNILRVSDGSRYEENLLPAFQDKTVQISGVDGTYYFGTNDTQKPFNISIAFDSLTEMQFRNLRNAFKPEIMGRLVFDECPYKYYMAKIQNPPTLKYVCFEIGGQRIYKGEGTLQFICYYPYAKNVYKYLNQYNDALYPNKNQWAAASQMLLTKGDYDTISNNSIKLYNPGDKSTDWKAFIQKGATPGTISIAQSGESAIASFTVGQVPSQSEKQATTCYCIDSKSNIIEGYHVENSDYENAVRTGEIVSKIVTGNFFKIPITIDTLNPLYFNISGCLYFKYDYIYY